jgi:hypothetical protein
MRNCKKEFLEEVKDKEIVCAEISDCRTAYDEEGGKHHLLPMGYSVRKWNLFLRSLDFEYDGGYGIQEIFGTIWYKDGTWSERGEYDGSEWWAYKSVPVIPEYLKNI